MKTLKKDISAFCLILLNMFSLKNKGESVSFLKLHILYNIYIVEDKLLT